MISPAGTGAACASMTVSNLSGQRPRTAGARLGKVLAGPGISADDAVVVLVKKYRDAPVEVFVFGQMLYSRRGEHLRLSGTVTKHAEKYIESGSGQGPRASVRLTIARPVLHTYHRERYTITLLGGAGSVVNELGALTFVADAAEWRCTCIPFSLTVWSSFDSDRYQRLR
jgi:hypothetical protein